MTTSIKKTKLKIRRKDKRSIILEHRDALLIIFYLVGIGIHKSDQTKKQNFVVEKREQYLIRFFNASYYRQLSADIK